MDGVILTSLKKIVHPKGDIFHAMKQSDLGFNGFGEAYFSNIKKDAIKGWKKHTLMTLNLIVPIGRIKFVIYDAKNQDFFTTILSQDNYKRLTISPNLWFAFKGLEQTNMILNLASIEHNPQETETKKVDEITYEW